MVNRNTQWRLHCKIPSFVQYIVRKQSLRFEFLCLGLLPLYARPQHTGTSSANLAASPEHMWRCWRWIIETYQVCVFVGALFLR